MSYGLSAALQSAIFTHLSADAPLKALIGSALFDAQPAGTVPELYVTLGSETVVDRSDQSGNGALHEINFLIITQHDGFLKAKEAAAALCKALQNKDLSLDQGAVVSCQFLRAKAVRVGRNDTRQITLTFRARVCGS